MKIEIFPSASGDCLLLTSSDDKRLLADAGLPKAYDDFIAAPLSALRTGGKPIDIAYVSHIDRDHIGGILKMLDHEVEWRAFLHMQGASRRRRPPNVPRPPEIKEIWHNAFLEDIQATRDIDLGTALAASAGALASANAMGLGSTKTAYHAARAEMLALSVGDAIEVNWRIGANQLDIPLNPPANGELLTASLPGQPVPLGSLTITVLGPTAKELKKLKQFWIKWLDDNARELARLRQQHSRDVERLGTNASPTALAALAHQLSSAIETDVTPPNLASLVLLVEENGKRVLLTGDAGDESLIRYLEAANLFDASGKIEVDVLKVPHHGADNSYSPEFVKRVRAQHYIFCGDGEHHNPEPDVVKGYLRAVAAAPLSGGRTTTFWFNWSSARATEFLDLWNTVEAMFAGRGVPPTIQRKSLQPNQDRLTLDLP